MDKALQELKAAMQEDPAMVEVARLLNRYSIGFADGEDSKPAGSGTVITFKQRTFLLTAAHVRRGFESQRPEGPKFKHVRIISASLGEGTFFPEVLKSFLIQYASVEYSPPRCSGPDICLIPVDPGLAGALKAKGKSFFELMDYPSNDDGYELFIMGIPALYTEGMPDPSFGQLAFRLPNLKRFQRDEWDYIECKIPSGPQNTKAPYSFAGVSGGGLWLLRRNAENMPCNPILIGVAFCQDPSEQDEHGNYIMTIRCHGLDSIRLMCEKVATWNSALSD